MQKWGTMRPSAMLRRTHRAVFLVACWAGLSAGVALAQDAPPNAAPEVPPAPAPPTPTDAAPPPREAAVPDAEEAASRASDPAGTETDSTDANADAEPAPAGPSDSVAPTPASQAPAPEPYVAPTAASVAAAPGVSATLAVDEGVAPSAEDDGGDEGPKLRWRNSLVLWDHAVSKNTFDEGSQLSYNPTYVQTLSVRPRWYFTDSLSLRLIQDMEVELTESDSTTRENQVLFDDTRLDLVESELVELSEITLWVGATVRLPLSLASQAQHRIASVGPMVGASRVLDVLEGLTLDLSGGYRYNIATRNVPATDTAYPCRLVGGQLSTGCDQASGLSSVAHVLSANLDASLAVVEPLSVTLGVGGAWTRGRGLASVDLANLGIVGANEVLEDESATHWRSFTDVHAYVTYAPEDWLDFDLGFATLTAPEDITGAAGRNPVFNPDTMFSLTMTVSVDALYLALADPPAKAD